jgi:hypothetical protein
MGVKRAKLNDCYTVLQNLGELDREQDQCLCGESLNPLLSTFGV